MSRISSMRAHVELGGPTGKPLLGVFAPLLLTLTATALWAYAIPGIDVRGMNDLGLIAVLPPLVFIAFAVLTVSFCLSLRQEPIPQSVILLHLSLLIVMLYGITAFVEEIPRFQSAWRHVGVTETIMRTGRIDPKIDAYFNWPGFFILSALITEICGYRTPLSLVTWAPVVFNLLWLGPLLMILRAVTADKRLPWLGLWLFYLTNSVGQDYFSPQALNYFFYLVIMALLVTWFKAMTVDVVTLPRYRGTPPHTPRIWGVVTAVLRSPDAPNAPSRPGQRAGLIAIVVLLFTAAVPSHQLTPFAIIGSVTLLVVFNRCTMRGLPILMTIVLATWLSYMTVSYLSGHFGALADDVGAVSSTIAAGVGERLQGSPGHAFIVRTRIVMTLALWGLALLGGLLRLWKGYKDFTYGLLAVAPFPLLALQSYGGEMLLRVYLFSLPFVVFFAAALFYRAPRSGTSWWTTALIGLVSLVLAGGFLLIRYGNERAEYFTANEVDAMHYLYGIAEPESLLIAGSPSTAWKFEGYEIYHYRTLPSAFGAPDILAWRVMNPTASDADTVARIMAHRNYPSTYLLITRAEIAHDELTNLWPNGSLAHLEQQLLESEAFQVIYANADARIFVLTDQEVRRGGT